MKNLFVLPFAAICFFLITPVWAEPRDVGSIECREVQIEAQGAIDDIFRNQGQKVSTAAKVVSSYEEAGLIRGMLILHN